MFFPIIHYKLVIKIRTHNYFNDQIQSDYENVRPLKL